MPTKNVEVMEVRKKPRFSKGIVQVFLNADMRNMHDGLQRIAERHGVAVDTLENGQFVIFINSAKDKVKIYAANDTISYTRSRSGKLQMEALQNIPKHFGGGSFDYDAALRGVLENLLARRAKQS